MIQAAKAYEISKSIKKSKNISKTTWKIINHEADSISAKHIRLRIEGEGLIGDPLRVANEFNSFFTSVAEQNKVQTGNHKPPMYSRCPADSMVLAPVVEHDVARVIQQLPSKKTNDFNYMSTWLIKQCSQHIVRPLTEVINASFKDGVFPSSLKIAKVIPVFKKDDPQSINNYRPISILPVFSKVFESLFLIQLTNFFEKHNLLSENQFGFRAGKSTTDAVASLVDAIVGSVEDREYALGIFLDLSKAFDCVDHNFLLQTIESYGIRGVPHLWLSSYLTDRAQSVQISQNTSSKVQLRYGVPQGSILSPFLFLVYVNNTGSSLQHGKIVQYADDTTLLFKSKSKESLEQQTYEDLNACIQHFHQINLQTNTSKSNFINFRLNQRNSEDLAVMLDDTLLEEADSVKFLGIHLDRGLTWLFHVDNVCSRVSSGIFALRKLSKYCPAQVLLMAYYGLVYPHLSYGIALWGGCSKTEFTRLFRLQKKAVRLILKLSSRESCKPGFSKLGLLTLPSLYILETAKFCLLKCVLTRGNDVHTYETRGRYNYRTGQHRTVVHERLPSQAGVVFVNKLPNEIKGAPTPQAFRANLKRILVSRAFYSVEEFMTCHWETEEPTP